MTVLPGLKEARAFDIRRETADRFAQEMSRRYGRQGLEVRAVGSAEEAVRGADIIVTVTVADEPIVKNSWIERGSFFAAVGSYQEEEFEVVTGSDRIVVDGIEHVLHRETPAIALMIRQGRIRTEDIVELGAIVCGEDPGRSSRLERIFFSPIGMAVEDVCLCHKVYKLALDQGIGTRLGLLGRDL